MQHQVGHLFVSLQCLISALLWLDLLLFAATCTSLRHLTRRGCHRQTFHFWLLLKDVYGYSKPEAPLPPLWSILFSAAPHSVDACEPFAWRSWYRWTCPPSAASTRTQRASYCYLRMSTIQPCLLASKLLCLPVRRSSSARTKSPLPTCSYVYIDKFRSTARRSRRRNPGQLPNIQLTYRPDHGRQSGRGEDVREEVGGLGCPAGLYRRRLLIAQRSS